MNEKFYHVTTVTLLQVSFNQRNLNYSIDLSREFKAFVKDNIKTYLSLICFYFDQTLRSAHTMGLVPATSPCNKSDVRKKTEKVAGTCRIV